MAEANSNPEQQSQDAQHLDNLTSLQQQPAGADGMGPQTNASASNVTPQNTPSPDGPSLYNAALIPTTSVQILMPQVKIQA